MKTKIISVQMAIIIFIILVLQACVPTSSTPLASGTFNVNQTVKTDAYEIKDTTVVIAGDSIEFMLSHINQHFIDYVVLGISTSSNSFSQLQVQKHFYDYSTNAYDQTNNVPSLYDVNTINAGVLINSSYSANNWIPFQPYAGKYIGQASLFVSSDASENMFNGVRFNTNEYIVLRKQTGSVFQYYWILVQANETSPASGIHRVKILNGKFQSNSITTGI